MLAHDLDESPGLWVCLAADAFKRVFAEEVAPYGISLRQAQLLSCLAYWGPMSQTELADKMHIEPPTLVGILDRMERDGWIRREACPEDRRKKMIHPTEAVEPIWSQILACGRRVRRRATEGLSDEDLQTLRRILQIMEDNLAPQVAEVQKAG